MQLLQKENWLRYLVTPFPRHLRHMGYVRELKALGQRQRRCDMAWKPHLQKTRALIVEAAEKCQDRRAALIVGSGLLFDIPLEQLCRLFDEVVLVDIIHLWPVRKHLQRYDNLRLVQCDVTGIVEQTYHSARKRQLPRLSPAPPGGFQQQGFDLVVSVNIASQLAVLPNGYVSRRVPEFTRERMVGFSRCLMQNHLDWLSSFPNRVCLIADLERLYHNDHRIYSREESLWGLSLPAGYREWCWNLAPRPEMSFRYDVSHRVAGFPDFPKQQWQAQSGLRGC